MSYKVEYIPYTPETCRNCNCKCEACCDEGTFIDEDGNEW